MQLGRERDGWYRLSVQPLDACGGRKDVAAVARREAVVKIRSKIAGLLPHSHAYSAKGKNTKMNYRGVLGGESEETLLRISQVAGKSAVVVRVPECLRRRFIPSPCTSRHWSLPRSYRAGPPIRISQRGWRCRARHGLWAEDDRNESVFREAKRIGVEAFSRSIAPGRSVGRSISQSLSCFCGTFLLAVWQRLLQA